MMLVSVSNTPDIIKGPMTVQTETQAATTTVEKKIVIDITNATTSKDINAITRAYFKKTPVLAEIARCESEFRQFSSAGVVLRGRVNSADVGVMQINEKYHLKTAQELGMDIYSLEGNMKYARHLYETQGVSPWKYSKDCWNDMSVAMK